MLRKLCKLRLLQMLQLKLTTQLVLQKQLIQMRKILLLQLALVEMTRVVGKRRSLEALLQSDNMFLHRSVSFCPRLTMLKRFRARRSQLSLTVTFSRLKSTHSSVRRPRKGKQRKRTRS